MRRSYSIVLKRRALSDIHEAAHFIAIRSDDPDVANIWNASLQDHINQLELYPASCPMYRVKPYRQLNHGMYKVLFRIDDKRQKVVVCRVIHSAQLQLKRQDIE